MTIMVSWCHFGKYWSNSSEAHEDVSDKMVVSQMCVDIFPFLSRLLTIAVWNMHNGQLSRSTDMAYQPQATCPHAPWKASFLFLKMISHSCNISWPPYNTLLILALLRQGRHPSCKPSWSHNRGPLKQGANIGTKRKFSSSGLDRWCICSYGGPDKVLTREWEHIFSMWFARFPLLKSSNIYILVLWNSSVFSVTSRSSCYDIILLHQTKMECWPFGGRLVRGSNVLDRKENAQNEAGIYRGTQNGKYIRALTRESTQISNPSKVLSQGWSLSVLIALKLCILDCYLAIACLCRLKTTKVLQIGIYSVWQRVFFWPLSSDTRWNLWFRACHEVLHSFHCSADKVRCFAKSPSISEPVPGRTFVVNIRLWVCIQVPQIFSAVHDKDRRTESWVTHTPDTHVKCQCSYPRHRCAQFQCLDMCSVRMGKFYPEHSILLLLYPRKYPGA